MIVELITIVPITVASTVSYHFAFISSLPFSFPTAAGGSRSLGVEEKLTRLVARWPEQNLKKS
jgi:hypothetical protein